MLSEYRALGATFTLRDPARHYGFTFTAPAWLVEEIQENAREIMEELAREALYGA